jgi:hypothetical protein
VDWFSLQLHKSTDISDTAHLAVVAKMVFSDFTVKVELLKVLPTKMGKKSEDIHNTFKTYAEEISTHLHRLSACIRNTGRAS